MPLQGSVLVSGAGTLTLTNANSVFVYSGSVAAVWTMPALAGNTGEILWLTNRGTGTVTVNRAGSNQFYAAGSLITSVPLPPGAELQIINDGTYWLVTSNTAATAPPFDHCAFSAAQSSLASGTPFTWTQTVGAGQKNYGLVAVHCSSVGGTNDPVNNTAVVTLGGVTLAPLGYISTSSWWIWVFGAPNIPAGTQTASVTITASASFTGFGASYTYSGVTTPAAFTTTAQSSGSTGFLAVPRTSPGAGRIWTGQSFNYQFTSSNFNAIQRQVTLQVFGAGVFGGDVGTSGTDDARLVNVFSGSTAAATVGLDLLASQPAGPYLTGSGDAIIGQGGLAQTLTFHHVVRAGDAVLLAIGYRTNAGSAITGATFNGTAMTAAGSVNLNNVVANGKLYLFSITGVAAGLGTIVLTQTGTGDSYCAQAFSYAQVSAVGVMASVFGTGTALSQGPISVGANQVLFHVFDAQNVLPTRTDPASQLFNNSGGSSVANLAVAQTVSTQTLAATIGSANPWAGAAVLLS